MGGDAGLFPEGETHTGPALNIPAWAWKTSGPRFIPWPGVSEVQVCTPDRCPPASSLRYEKDENKPGGS